MWLLTSPFLIITVITVSTWIRATDQILDRFYVIRVWHYCLLRRRCFSQNFVSVKKQLKTAILRVYLSACLQESEVSDQPSALEGMVFTWGEGGGTPIFSWDEYNVCAAVQDMVFLHLESWTGVFFSTRSLRRSIKLSLSAAPGGLHLKRNKVSIAALHVNEQEFRRVF